MFVRVYDLGTPSRTSQTQATVTITVLRNINCPTFSNLPANINIQQSQTINSRIFNVSAFDSDANVSILLFSSLILYKIPFFTGLFKQIQE